MWVFDFITECVDLGSQVQLAIRRSKKFCECDIVDLSLLYTRDFHAITLRSIQWAESRGLSIIVPVRLYPPITSNIQYASYSKTINGTCSFRQEQCFRDKLQSVYKMSQVSIAIKANSIPEDCTHLVRHLMVDIFATDTGDKSHDTKGHGHHCDNTITVRTFQASTVFPEKKLTRLPCSTHHSKRQ